MHLENREEEDLPASKDTIDASIQRLEDYIEKHERGPITTIGVDTDNAINERMTTTRKQKWEGKPLYGHFKASNKQHLTPRKPGPWPKKRKP